MHTSGSTYTHARVNTLYVLLTGNHSTMSVYGENHICILHVVTLKVAYYFVYVHNICTHPFWDQLDPYLSMYARLGGLAAG